MFFFFCFRLLVGKTLHLLQHFRKNKIQNRSKFCSVFFLATSSQNCDFYQQKKTFSYIDYFFFPVFLFNPLWSAPKCDSPATTFPRFLMALRESFLVTAPHNEVRLKYWTKSLISSAVAYSSFWHHTSPLFSKSLIFAIHMVDRSPFNLLDEPDMVVIKPFIVFHLLST